MSLKLKIARAQLGTALDLFIRNKDPLSVHALACGGTEVMEGVAEQASSPTLSTHILETFPGMDVAKIKRLRNQYWNAIKHFYNRDNKTARDDEALMAEFSDIANDVVLFMGWLDYMRHVEKLPVEVQVFQVWWFATNEDKLNPNADLEPHRCIFPSVANDDRSEQKRRLRRAVEKYKKDPTILADAKTERGSLMEKA